MPISKVKLYTPTTPGRRKTSVIDYKAILTTNDPHKPLLISKKNSAGRSHGKITVRHRGGGYRKVIRQINFKRIFETGFKVETIEYDPNRSAFISLVVDLKSGDKHYILFTRGMEVGKTYSDTKEIQEGNSVPLKLAPIGTLISQVELNPGQGAKLVRGAGNYAQVTAREGGMVTLKLPSGETRKFQETCTCVIGRVGNEAFELVRIGKAGRVRNKGWRPSVRGKAMNPVDHPHGGGEARNSIGMKYPKTPWGKHALGVRTRNKKKLSSKFIVKRRSK